MEKEPTGYLYTVTSSYTQFILEISLPEYYTLKPASLARQKQSATAATVCPLFVSRATSS